MEEASDRGARAARREAMKSGATSGRKTARVVNARGETATKGTSSGPDWEALPEPALFRILQRATPEYMYRTRNSFSYFLVCKRWWAVARQALQEFATRKESGIDQGSLLVRALAQFPNLTSVQLNGPNISDFVLGALGHVCPKLVHLSLDEPSDPDEEDLPELEGLTPAGLANAFDVLTGLQRLDFGLLDFRLPDSISSLQKLESLDITKCSGPLPEALGALPSLKTLSVSDGEEYCGDPPITALPASISGLTCLEELNVDLDNADEPLPEELGHLTSLRKLTVSSISLTALNESLTDLCSLEELVLECRELRSLPRKLCKLNKLHSLTLDGNSLRTMPPCLLGASEAGQTLGLESLSLQNFEPELTGGLACFNSTLRSLSLFEFNHYLPYQIGSLSRLESLSLESCRTFQYFPETFGDLVSLQELSITSCYNVEALPRALSGCAQLQSLKISHCPRLKTLPEDLGDIPTFRTLILEFLPLLERFPPTLIHAKGLQELSVNNCPRVFPLPGLLDLPSLSAFSRARAQKALEDIASAACPATGTPSLTVPHPPL